MSERKNKAQTVNLICHHCGEQFVWLERYRFVKGRPRQFCKKECYWASRREPWVPRFWKYTAKTNTCWLWIGTLNDGGYGVLTVPRQSGLHGVAAHRLSWEIHRGAIPNGLNVCHKCDIRNCVNPDHLFLGTDQDNMDDMTKKGRSLKGERNRNSKLNADIVREIRRRYALPRKSGDIKRMSVEFGIDRTNIHAIVTRQTWNHVE